MLWLCRSRLSLGGFLFGKEIECADAGLRLVGDWGGWSLALKEEKLIEFFEGEGTKAVGIAEGDYDAVKFRVVPQVGVDEGSGEGLLLLQAPEVVVYAGIIDGVSVWVVPATVFCREGKEVMNFALDGDFGDLVHDLR